MGPSSPSRTGSTVLRGRFLEFGDVFDQVCHDLFRVRNCGSIKLVDKSLRDVVLCYFPRAVLGWPSRPVYPVLDDEYHVSMAPPSSFFKELPNKGIVHLVVGGVLRVEGVNSLPYDFSDFPFAAQSFWCDVRCLRVDIVFQMKSV